jgi:hypothetical protein
LAAEVVPVLTSPHTLAARDSLWEHCRNHLAIARLLAQEGRPEPFLATACHGAVENACRAALEHSGAPFDGDLASALDHLSAPPELLARIERSHGSERLTAAESAVAWVARYLRAEAPERGWGF